MAERERSSEAYKDILKNEAVILLMAMAAFMLIGLFV